MKHVKALSKTVPNTISFSVQDPSSVSHNYTKAWLVVDSLESATSILKNVAKLSIKNGVIEYAGYNGFVWVNAMNALDYKVHHDKDNGRFYIPLMFVPASGLYIELTLLELKEDMRDLYSLLVHEEYVGGDSGVASKSREVVLPSHMVVTQSSLKASEVTFKFEDAKDTAMLSFGVLTPDAKCSFRDAAMVVGQTEYPLFNNLFEAYMMDRVANGRTGAPGVLTHTFSKGDAALGNRTHHTLRIHLNPDLVPDGLETWIIVYKRHSPFY